MTNFPPRSKLCTCPSIAETRTTCLTFFHQKPLWMVGGYQVRRWPILGCASPKRIPMRKELGSMSNPSFFARNKALHNRSIASVFRNGLTVLATLLCVGSAVEAQSPGTTESLAAWDKIVTVLQHPRCLNCHQLISPLQGDGRRAHIPHVVRGSDNRGVGTMRCGNCHNDAGNNLTSRTPGGPHWSLAPISMLWQGLSSGDLCRMLKDPARNGKRSPQDL